MTENKWLMPVSVVLAGLFIAGAVVWNGQHPAQQGAAAGGTPPAPAVNIADVSMTGEPFIGSATAPVTIAAWSDYQCPFCKEWEITTLPQIIQDYVNAGKVKVVFKDYPFLWAGSMDDAEYARAVWELYPQQYFAWRTAMFTTQPAENSQTQAQNLSWIQRTTGSITGIDVSKVEAAVAANKATYDAAINADKAEGSKFGINATPSFVVGKQLIAGAYPYATFQQAIDSALAASK